MLNLFRVDSINGLFFEKNDGLVCGRECEVKNFKKLCIFGFVVIFFIGCVMILKSNCDLFVYYVNMLKFILVLLFVNELFDIWVIYGYWFIVILFVVEVGYYVFFIFVVDMLFKENGVINGYDV